MRASLAHSRKDGMTILEVVIALICFAVAIGAMSSLTYSVRQSSDIARDHYIAVNLAKSRIERMKTYDFDQLYVFVEDRVRVNVNGLADASGDFRRTTVVAAAGLNLVRVTVTIDIFNHITLTFAPAAETVSTYIAKIQGPA